MEIGDYLRQRRQFLQLKQEDLEELSGINKKTIQLVEAGKGNPSLSTLEKLADVLGLIFSVHVKQVENG